VKAPSPARKLLLVPYRAICRDPAAFPLALAFALADVDATNAGPVLGSL
jgi:hypothetical protein